jgi:hypothetical protein
MANNFTANPWVIDTVMANAITQNLKISNIVWTEQVAAGDQLVILDQAGNTILDIKASSANIVQTLGNFQWVNGLKVTVLTSGKLYIYIR